MFIIEVEIHAEPIGERFQSKDEAMAELERLAMVPWDEEPNCAPCTGWETCGRRYELIEYDDASHPWREISRKEILSVSASGVQWLSAHE